MSIALTEPLNSGASLADGVRFTDVHEPGVYLDAMPQDPSGNVEIEVGVEAPSESEGFFATLSPAQRRTLAAVLLGMDDEPFGAGQLVQNVGKFRVVIETGTNDWQVSPEDFDYMWSRAGWHVRNGIPGQIAHASGCVVSVHELGDESAGVRGMSETRRQYRYRLAGDAEGVWRYHSNYRTVRKLNPIEVESQRSFRGDWSKA